MPTLSNIFKICGYREKLILGDNKINNLIYQLLHKMENIYLINLKVTSK